MKQPIPSTRRKRRYKKHGLSAQFRTLGPAMMMPDYVSEGAARSLVAIGDKLGWKVWRKKVAEDAYEVGREK